MKSMNTFGAYIHEQRIDKGLSLRSFSSMIDISPEYLSKIENGLRTAPKDNILEKIADKLFLSEEEREFLFDLAIESKPYFSISVDLVKYVNNNEMVKKTLRLAKRNQLTNEDWKEIFEYINNFIINTLEDPSY